MQASRMDRKFLPSMRQVETFLRVLDGLAFIGVNTTVLVAIYLAVLRMIL